MKIEKNYYWDFILWVFSYFLDKKEVLGESSINILILINLFFHLLLLWVFSYFLDKKEVLGKSSINILILINLFFYLFLLPRVYWKEKSESSQINDFNKTSGFGRAIYVFCVKILFWEIFEKKNLFVLHIDTLHYRKIQLKEPTNQSLFLTNAFTKSFYQNKILYWMFFAELI